MAGLLASAPKWACLQLCPGVRVTVMARVVSANRPPPHAHYLLADDAIGLKEFSADVHVFHGSTGEFRDQLIHFHARFTARVGFFTGREKAEEENFGLWLFGLDQVNHRFDTRCSIRWIGILGPHVVGADQDDEKLRLVILQLAVLETPEHMLR
jgi:hypothetical protein